jgi:CarD family transcriptional regulator
MVFKVGETVVYPHHGAALIEEIKTRRSKERRSCISN